MLDTLVRRAQDDQTVGLPIGPDSSLVLVETILAPVDKLLRQRLGNDVLVYRRVDDYEFGVPTLAAAEDAIATLQHLLADFELTLNPRKRPKTLELPQPLEAEWAESLREFRFRDTPGKQKSDLIRYFDLAFREAQRHPDEAVIKFAVARFRSPATKVAPENWDSFQQLMVHSMTVTPGVASEILSELVRYERSGYVLNKPLVERWVNLQVRRHAPLGHGNEVVWALWAALAFDIRLDQKATDVLQSMGDSAVAVSALDANARGLLHADFQPKLWEQYLTGDGLYGEHWLLSYEANVHGWLPSPSGSDHVANDPAFGYLKSSGVKFYEPVSREPAPPSIEVVLFSGKEDLAGSAEEPFIEAAPSEDFYAY